MDNFRDLNVWQKAVELATKIYQATDHFPKTENYGLTSQIRRSAVSISSNIAEGAGRRSHKEFRQFLDVATGSCYELETQLTISKNLGYIDQELFQTLKKSLIEIQKMIYALINSLEA
jgi:four helix bundle protein